MWPNDFPIESFEMTENFAFCENLHRNFLSMCRAEGPSREGRRSFR